VLILSRDPTCLQRLSKAARAPRSNVQAVVAAQSAVRLHIAAPSSGDGLRRQGGLAPAPPPPHRDLNRDPGWRERKKEQVGTEQILITQAVFRLRDCRPR
jgi:hypothetical protein